MQGISVIIPVLNRERYLGEAMESVRSQTYEGPIEIIVSDDGSTDRSLEIAESFGKLVRIVRCPEGARHGPGLARNRGLSVAKYPLVAFLDSDDIYLSGHLSGSERFLAENEDLVMAIDEAYGMNAEGEQRWRVLYPKFGEILPEVILLDPFFPTNAVVLRKAVLEKCNISGFDEALQFSEDQDLWLRIAERYAVATFRGGGVAFREHETRSIAAHRAPTYMGLHRDRMAVFEKALARFSYPPRFIRKRRAAMAYRLAEGHYHNGLFVRSLLQLLKAAVLDTPRAASTVWGACRRVIKAIAVPKK
ncbi:glycosyltransferase [archaeon]|nr:MAG: glycosyltransferase [archaeon]